MIPRLHVVTDDTVLARPDFPELALALLGAGAGDVALHIRGPHSDGARIYALATTLRDRAGSAADGLVVNDRVDVARAAGLCRVHLGGRSLRADVARALLAPEARIGCSVHDVVSAREAGTVGADYIFVGALYPTPSHPGEASLGASGAARAGAGGGVPWVGIGGIHVDHCAEVARAGGHGVAVLRGIWGVDDPVRAVERYLSALDDAGPARSDA